MNDRCLISAECGLNHGGSLDRAFKLVEAAANAGADIAKFQTFIVEAVLRRTDPDYDRIARLALPFSAFVEIKQCCDAHGIEFCSTPGDVDSLWFLVQECHVKRIKIGSDDLMNRELVRAAYKSGLPVVLSTGMATMKEISTASLPRMVVRDADPVLWGQMELQTTLLHCVSLYPCPDELANLRAMDTLREFGWPVGYSDHCAGIDIAVFAAARGACMIEKHMMLDDHAKVGVELPIDAPVSVGPGEFKFMAQMIRLAETAMGDGCKEPGSAEATQRERLRKGADGLRGSID